MAWEKQKAIKQRMGETFVRSKGRYPDQSEFAMRLGILLMRDTEWDEAVARATAETRVTYPAFSPMYMPGIAA
jgi:hypothetical protein